MSNWGTMIQRLKDECVRSNAAEDDKFARCVEWAIRHYRQERFFFNEASYDFNTTDGTASYGQESSSGAADGYPSDMLAFIGFTIDISDSLNPVEPISISAYRNIHSHSTDTGYPELVAWYDEQFWFWPTPNGTMSVTLDYIKDLGTPINSYDATSDAWSTTVGGSAITDAYTNSWFTHGQNLIAARARFHFYSKFDRNKEEAALARADEFDELKRLRDQSNKAVLPPKVVPFV